MGTQTGQVPGPWSHHWGGAEPRAGPGAVSDTRLSRGLYCTALQATQTTPVAKWSMSLKHLMFIAPPHHQIALIFNYIMGYASQGNYVETMCPFHFFDILLGT